MRGDVVLYGGLSLLRCFASKAFYVTIVDTDAGSLSFLSRYCSDRQIIACPKNDPEQAVRDLVALGKTYARRPMLAWDNDNVLQLVSRNRERLSEYYRFLLPPADLIEDMVCKLRFADLAKRKSLPVPRSIVPQDETSAEEIAQAVGLPCILKPNTHVGRFRIWVAQQGQGHRAYKVLRSDTIEELREKLRQMQSCSESFVAQEYIHGKDDSLYSFHTYIGPDHRPLGWFVGRKIRTYPKDSGFSTYLQLVDQPDIARLGLQILDKLEFVGPMKIDFKVELETGRILVLECNPRFTLWNYLAAASGMNLPAMAFAQLQGEAVTPVAGYGTRHRWTSLGNDLRALIREYRPAREWGWPSYLLSLCHRKVYENFAWRDPWPGLVCAGRYIQANCRKVKRRVTRSRERDTVAPVT
jgi:D-aspartate ligase